MTRQKVISILAQNMLNDYPLKKRDETINTWHLMGYKENDIEIKIFSTELKHSLTNFDEIKNFEDSMFDPLIVQSIKDSFIGVKNSFIAEKLKLYDINVDFIEDEEEKLFSCQCCGYKTLKEKYFYNICKVCFWEDEELFEGDDFSDCNHMTLREGKKNFKTFGACDREALKYIDKEGPLKYFK